MTDEKRGPGVAEKPPTSAQLRHDIDMGRTGSKVGHPDPAASPLGTDDEAAGTPPTGDQIAHARAQEIRQASDLSGEQPVRKSRVKFWVWSIATILVLAFVMALMRG